MKQVDYIVVGLGIAGISICQTLRKHKKSFVVFDGGIEGATAKSGGVFNPTVLKRFNPVWKADVFFPKALRFYETLSADLQKKIFSRNPILRIFSNVEEQNNWAVACDRKILGQFLSAECIPNSNAAIRAPFGFGKVMGAAQIDTVALLRGYRQFLMEREVLSSEKFEYNLLQQQEDGISYKGISAKKIIFAEGAGALRNPFFPERALIANKGEYIVVHAPQLKFNALLKGPMYVIPLGNHHYKIGATYSRDDFSTAPTAEARDEILTKVNTFINCPFTVVDQTAGLRPTTRDHRPLLGSVTGFPNMVFLNGLGSRGFLMAPFLSEIIYQYIATNTPIPAEMDIGRTVKWS